MPETIKTYLKQLISFQSVSSDKSKAAISRKTAEYIIDQLKNLGATTKLVENEEQGNNPLIFAKIGSQNSDKPTILCYSHYDVQPAALEDGWDTDPFEMTEKNGYLYGRGTSDDKGPIVALYTAIQELQQEVPDLPVNIAFLYEGEEESSSGGFEASVNKHKNFFGKIDGILVLDTSWFGETKPSMDYGFRGIAYMGVEISGPKKDEHSGSGGSMREPMTDLIYLLSKLKNLDGKILVDGFYDQVKELTKEEEALYENVEFDLQAWKDYLGVKALPIEDPKEVLMNMWRHPSLSIHGIEGAFAGPGSKTVIPAKVTGKVSMRLVPNQNPKQIADLFTKFVENEFQALNSPNNSLQVKILGLGDWWYGDVNNFLFKAGEKAITEYWKIKPSYTRSGGSIPIIPFMEKLFKAPAMGFAIGQNTDGAHSQNEHIRIENLVGAKEVLKIMFHSLSI